MKSKTSLSIILAIAIFGILFSGYLSYYTLFTTGCTEAIISCGGGEPVEIFGLPTCVYGLFMYIVVTILTILAIKKESALGIRKAILVIAIVGVLFSGSLSYYELFMQDTEFTELPACVYGLIMYVTILIFSICSVRKQVQKEPEQTIEQQ